MDADSNISIMASSNSRVPSCCAGSGFVDVVYKEIGQAQGPAPTKRCFSNYLVGSGLKPEPTEVFSNLQDSGIINRSY